VKRRDRKREKVECCVINVGSPKLFHINSCGLLCFHGEFPFMNWLRQLAKLHHGRSRKELRGEYGRHEKEETNS